MLEIFLGDVVLIVAYIINRMPTKILYSQIPADTLRASVPFLQKSLFIAFVHIPNKSDPNLILEPITCVFFRLISYTKRVQVLIHLKEEIYFYDFFCKICPISRKLNFRGANWFGFLIYLFGVKRKITAMMEMLLTAMLLIMLIFWKKWS